LYAELGDVRGGISRRSAATGSLKRHGTGPGPGVVRVWTLQKDGRSAACGAQAHVLSVELAAMVDADPRRSEVARTPAAAQKLADEWRMAFIGKGWIA
jgi:hypothetical protein